MSDSSSYILVYLDASLPNSRVLTVGQGLSLSIGGGGGNIEISPGDRLTSLATMSTNGIVVYTANTKTYSPQVLSAGSGITIGNPDGQGSMVISQAPASVLQKINLARADGSVITQNSVVRFIGGAGIHIDIANGGSSGDVTITGTATGTVTSINATSSTGIIPGGVPITSSGTMTIDLPGSGDNSAVQRGDVLVAFEDIDGNKLYAGKGVGTAYNLLGTDGSDVVYFGGTAVADYVMTFNGATALWAPAAVGVNSIQGDSSTGLLAHANSTTGAVVLNVDFIGSGGGDPLTGDTLVGVGASHSFVAMPIGAANTYYQSNGTTVVWGALNANGIDLITANTGTLGLGVVPTAAPLYATVGGGTLTLLNKFGSANASAGIGLMSTIDTSAVTATATNRLTAFVGANTGTPHTLEFYTARGSSTSPAALAANDYLGTVDFYGQYDTTLGHYVKGASIACRAESAFTTPSSGHRTSLRFFICANPDAAPREVGYWDQTGQLRAEYGMSATALVLDTPLEYAQGGTGPFGTANQFFQIIAGTGVPGWDNLFTTAGGAATAGTATTITTTHTVSTAAVTSTSIIIPVITAAPGSPTLAPQVVINNRVAGVSFDIVPIAVGGAGQASSVTVSWVLINPS